MHYYAREKEFRNIVGSEVEDYDGAALEFLANKAPILNPLRPYCPLGRVSPQEARLRSIAGGC